MARAGTYNKVGTNSESEKIESLRNECIEFLRKQRFLDIRQYDDMKKVGTFQKKPELVKAATDAAKYAQSWNETVQKIYGLI